MAWTTLLETLPRAALLAEDRLEVTPAKYAVYAVSNEGVAKSFFGDEREAWDHALQVAGRTEHPALLVHLQSGNAWRMRGEEVTPVRVRTPIPSLVLGGPDVIELVRRGCALLVRRQNLVVGGVYRIRAPMWARLREPVLQGTVLVRVVASRPGLMSTESRLYLARVGEGPWVG